MSFLKKYSRLERFIEMNPAANIPDRDIRVMEDMIIRHVLDGMTEKEARRDIAQRLRQRGHGSYIHGTYPFPLIIEYRIMSLYGHEVDMDDICIMRLHDLAELRNCEFDEVWMDFKNCYDFKGMHPDMKRKYMKDRWAQREDEEKEITVKKEKDCVLDATDDELLGLLAYLEQDSDDDDHRKKKAHHGKVDIDLTAEKTKKKGKGNVDIDLTLDDSDDD